MVDKHKKSDGKKKNVCVIHDTGVFCMTWSSFLYKAKRKIKISFVLGQFELALRCYVLLIFTS